MSILFLAKFAAPLLGVLGMLSGLLFGVRMAQDEPMIGAEVQQLQLDAEIEREFDGQKLEINGQEIEIEDLGGELKIEIEVNEDGTFEVVPAEPEAVEE